MRDISTKLNGDSYPADVYNSLRDEVQNAVSASDQTLDSEAGPDNDLNMLGKTMALNGSAADFYSDGGAANAYVLSRTTNLKNVPAYKDGMSIVFKAANINTGSSTINVSSLGAVDLVNDQGIALTGGEVSTTVFNFARYNNTNSNFELIQYSGLSPLKNAILNPDFRIAERGISFTSATVPANDDDTYLLDRGLLLSDGDNIVDVTQSTDAPVGSLNSWQFDVETISKKFAYVQIIEQKNCEHLIGGVASLSFDAKVSDISKLDNIKAAIISWDSTADVVTSDVISTWNVEDTTPTLVANWTFENTPANLGVTASWAKYTIKNISIDTASTTNIALIIWSDGFSDTLGITFNITNLKVEQGAYTTDYDPRSIGEERLLCREYFKKWGDDSAVAVIGAAQSRNTALFYLSLTFEEMRIAPTITLDTGADFEGVPAGSDTYTDLTFSSVGSITKKGALIIFGGTFTNAIPYIARAKADKYINADAEL